MCDTLLFNSDEGRVAGVLSKCRMSMVLPHNDDDI